MVNYSEEFVEKCKMIYPTEEGLHRFLKSKAWIVQEILGDLFVKYKKDFINEIIDHDLSIEEMNLRIRNLRIASKLQSESKTFD